MSKPNLDKIRAAAKKAIQEKWDESLETVCDYVNIARPTTIIAMCDEIKNLWATNGCLRLSNKAFRGDLKERDRHLSESQAENKAMCDRIEELEKQKEYARCKHDCAINSHALNTKCTCGFKALKGNSNE